MAEFGTWAPDLPAHGHDGLVVARNIFPGPLGYEPFRDFVAVTADATTGSWLGGGAFEESDGTVHLLAGTTAGVELYNAGTWTTKHSDTYSGKWSFAQFGNTVIGVADGDTPPVAYNMPAGTAAALAGSPPNASMIAIVGDFVFLAGDLTDQYTVTWSAINNSTGWTAGTDQSDSQLIPDGGPITGLAGGEYGLVFQQSAISIFEYVGTPLIFTRKKLTDALGALTSTGIAQAGNLVFFLSNRGFYMFNDGELTSIGKDRVDRSFFAQYSVVDIQTSLRAVIEPNLNLVIWSMPNRLWIYNWAADKWSEVTYTGMIGVTTGRTGYLTLDQIEAIYTGVDDVPGGVDSPTWQGGDPMLLVVHEDDIHYAFGDTDYLPATMQAAKLEPYPGNDAHIWNARINGDVTSGATVTLSCSARLSDAQTEFQSSDYRANGDFPLIARGRFVQPRVEINGVWQYVQGIDIEGRPGGRL